MNQTKNKFGKNLKEVIDFLGITQSDLSKKANLTQASISQIINGSREPSLGTILKILNVLQIKFERLVK